MNMPDQVKDLVAVASGVGQVGGYAAPQILRFTDIQQVTIGVEQTVDARALGQGGKSGARKARGEAATVTGAVLEIEGLPHGANASGNKLLHKDGEYLGGDPSIGECAMRCYTQQT
jgi:hypothetical protein